MSRSESKGSKNRPNLLLLCRRDLRVEKVVTVIRVFRIHSWTVGGAGVRDTSGDKEIEYGDSENLHLLRTVQGILWR